MAAPPAGPASESVTIAADATKTSQVNHTQPQNHGSLVVFSHPLRNLAFQFSVWIPSTPLDALSRKMSQGFLAPSATFWGVASPKEDQGD